jgi:hypothetical protein
LPPHRPHRDGWRGFWGENCEKMGKCEKKIKVKGKRNFESKEFKYTKKGQKQRLKDAYGVDVNISFVW